VGNSELKRDFVRVERTESRIRVEVGVVEWVGACSPSIRWVRVFEVPARIGESALQSLIDRLVEMPEYFAVCCECGERQPVGMMHDVGGYCQSCAERNHGVVY
jgi:hypothetical protein